MKLNSVFMLIGWLVANHIQLHAQTWQLHMNRGNLELSDVVFVNAQSGFVFGDSSVAGVNITGVVLKTTNGGQSWTTETLGDPSYSTTRAFALNSQELFSAGRAGGGNNGLFIKSADGGVTWTNPYNFSERLNNVFFLNSSNGWVMGKNGLLYRTSDGGVTWNALNVTGEDLFSMRFFNGTTGLLSGGGGELYRTTDGGLSWLPVASNVPDNLLSIAVSGYEAWICGEAGTVIYSGDQGQTWYIQTAASPTDFNVIAAANTSQLWMAGLAGTINYTTNAGQTWTDQPSGTAYEITGLSVPDVNHGWYCNGNGDVYSFNTANGLDDQAISAMTISAYPNPAADHIEIRSRASYKMQLVVTSAQGMIIHNQWLEPNATLMLETATWATGVYFLRSVADAHKQSGEPYRIVKL